MTTHKMGQSPRVPCSCPPPDTATGSPDPAKCDAGHTKTPKKRPASIGRPSGVLTLPVVPPISDYAARLLTARAAAQNAPFRPTGAPAPYRLPVLLPAVPAGSRCVHALTVIDDHGRIRPGAFLLGTLGWLLTLGWAVDPPLVCAVTGAAAVLAADPSGLPLLDPQGRLCLPLAARRALGLISGSRVLLSIVPAGTFEMPAPGRLIVQPATALDTLTAVTNA